MGLRRGGGGELRAIAASEGEAALGFDVIGGLGGVVGGVGVAAAALGVTCARLGWGWVVFEVWRWI